ncbi:MAG: hypothetical protein CMH41_10460 [Micrococcales bacterium]|nr:hypothetical protein [Micrococcales bacterium]
MDESSRTLTGSDDPEFIRSRVSVPYERIIFMDELPVVSPFTVTIMWDRIDEIAADWSHFVITANLVHTMRPDTKSRHELTKRIGSQRIKLRRLVAATGNNAVIRAAAWFVLGRNGIPVTVVTDNEEALQQAIKELAS